MSLPRWKVAETAWDILILGGYILPGQWEITVSPARKVQVKESKDADGTVLDDTGYSGAKVTGRGRLWTDEQVSEFYALVPLFHPRNLGGASQPVTIVNPVSTLWGVKAIYAPKWSTSTPDGDFLTVTFDAMEWFPATKDKAPSPPGTTGGGPASPPEDSPPLDLTPPEPNPKVKGGKVSP